MLNRFKNYLIYTLIVSPIVFVCFLVSNFFLIRVYIINSRIGHLSEDFFLYMCKKKEEKKKTKKIIIDFFAIDESNHKANIELKKIISSEVSVLPFFLIKHFFFFLKIVSKKFVFFKSFLAYEKNSKKDGYRYFSNKFFFKFSYERINVVAKDFFREKRLDINQKFVCLNLWTSKHIDSVDHTHHDHRRISIEPYLKLIEYLNKKNYYIFKIGRSHSPTLLNNFTNFVDLSYDQINDTLDIFLLKNCHTYISTQSGLDHLAFALNKPMLINTATIHDYFIERPNILYLLRPYFKKNSYEKISIEKIIHDYNLDFKYKSVDFQNANILIGENRANEILKAYQDLEFLIDNNFENSLKNKKKSDAFWNLFLQAKKKHIKDYEYYRSKKLLAHYSWSNFNN